MEQVKRRWLIAVPLLTLVLVVIFALPEIRAGQSRLPVIIISVSSLRFDRVMAAKPQTLPHLADFRRQALLFTRAYSVSPNTVSAMASLVTGLSVQEHRVWEKGDQLMNRNVAMATAFRAKQYPAAAFSGSGLPGSANLLRGFAESADGLGTGRGVNAKLFSWLDREQLAGSGRPFLAWLHYSDLLAPYDVDRRLARGDNDLAMRADDADWYGVAAARGRRHAPAKREQLNHCYDGAVRTLDYYLGRLFAGLRQRGYHQGNSVIVITGLTGETLDDAGAEQWYSHNHRMSPEVLHIPLLWSSPQQPGGRCVVDPVMLNEVLPQLLRAGSGFDATFDQARRLGRARAMIMFDAERATGRARAALLQDGLLMVRENDGAARAYPTEGRSVTAEEGQYAAAGTQQRLQPLLDNCPPLQEQSLRTVQLRSLGYLH